jgi:amino acid adenylation domain-containing protein
MRRAVPRPIHGADDEVVAALLAVLARYTSDARVPLTLNGHERHFRVDGDDTPAGVRAAVQEVVQLGRSAETPGSHAGRFTVSLGGEAPVVHDGDAALHVTAEAVQLCFDPAWLPESMAEAILAQLVLAVAWSADHATTPLRGLDLVQDEARALVRDRFNATAYDHGRAPVALHALVMAQAERTPDGIAVIAGDMRLTYAQLVARAGHLATVLRTQYAVQPGDCVGIMAARTESLIIALLGILRAGAAYVPVNPRHPAELVAYMLTNAGADVLLADAESVSAASLHRGQLGILELELEDGGAPHEAPVVDDDVQGVAYVIYTSGSTGRPKGSAVSHRAIFNTLAWRARYYGFSPRDVVLQVPAVAFDSSVADIFSALASGATLVMIPEERRLEAPFVRALCDAHGVTTAIFTPGYYRLLLDDLAGCPTLRVLTVAGESVSPALVAAHHRVLPHVTLVNEYGPTEAAVCTTAMHLPPASTSIPIGTPIDNMRVHLIDAHGRLCGVGMPGELWLTGAGLAEGYINDPERTAERFRTSPVADIPGRLYMTGDRGCWRADGTLEFFGRVDRQVKVRGFRVELEEIDMALAALPGVRHAATITRIDAAGETGLVAFVEGDALTPGTVREGLARSLPHYMVPEAVRVLDAMPLTLNGKIDRAELLAREEHGALAGGQDACRSPLEEHLRAIMEEVLQRQGLGATDNFFDLGGNSLRVMEMTGRVWKELGQVLHIGDLYEHPTVRQLALHLATRAATA